MTKSEKQSDKWENMSEPKQRDMEENELFGEAHEQEENASFYCKDKSILNVDKCKNVCDYCKKFENES